MLVNGSSQEIEIAPKISAPLDEGLKQKYNLNRNIGSSQIDYSMFWRIIFGDRAQVFSNLFTVSDFCVSFV